MSHPRDPLPILPFVGCIHAGREVSPDLTRTVGEVIGPVALQSDSYPFDWTDHYTAEMGDNLYRTFFFAGSLESRPENLMAYKIRCYELEEVGSIDGNRRINLDPGYLNAHQVVVATFKNFAHRIYLGRGIYAHLEYLFHGARPEILPWTYPDFRGDAYRTLFAEARKIYMDVFRKGEWEVQDLNL